MENTKDVTEISKYVTLDTLKTYDNKLKDWTKDKYNIPVFETWEEYEANKDSLPVGTKFIVKENDKGSFGEKQILSFPTKADFPSVGETDVYYIDEELKIMCRYNGSGYDELGVTKDEFDTAINNIYTKTQTDAVITNKVAEIVAEAPEDFDTLKEMSDWISSHENSASAMNTAIQGKVTAPQTATVGQILAVKAVDGNGKPTEWEAVTDNDTTYSAATTLVDGLMSATDKTKLDGIATGATAVSEPTVSGWGFTKNTGTVTKVKVGSSGTEYSPSSGVVTIPAYPTSLPASNTTNSYSATGTVPVSGTAVASALSSYVKTDDSRLTDARASNDVQAYAKTGSGITVDVSVPSNAKFTDTTYSSKTAASGGTDVSLVTTGEKYTWNNKASTSTVTTSTNGLMSAADKTKLDGIATGANAYSLPTATSSTKGGVIIGSNISVSSGTISLTKNNVTSALGYTPPTTNTTYSNFVKSGSGAAAGLVPAPSTTAGTTKYLREDGTWQVPPDNNTTYNAATTSAAGLMSAADKTKLDGIATGANAYSLPIATSSVLGGVKVGGNVSITASGMITITRDNVTSALGYTPPTTNTTYSAATTSANGLMSSADKTKLNGIATGATAIGKLDSTEGTMYHGEIFNSYSDHPTYGDIMNKAPAWCAHAEGKHTTASGEAAHAEGEGTEASGSYSHAEGFNTTASGMASHTEGADTTASQDYSHAEGNGTEASGYYSHAEGSSTTASGYSSHAEGDHCKASGYYSHAEGNSTTASNYSSHASGKYNVSMTTGGANNNTTGTAFVIGNGTSSSAKSNAFSVQYTGVVKAKSTITASTTADYAEFFEWEDGNICSEDRIGHFVTLDGNKIRIATAEDDYILGVVSGEPFVLGNGDCDTWNGMYLRDEFRRTKYEPAPKMEEILDENGHPTGEYKEVEGEYEGTRPILNPEYDSTKPYISRFNRSEWSPIGMLGVLAVYHDGTAKVNGYVTVNKDGIATACEKSDENSYRVIKSNTNNVVEIIFR